MAYKVGGEVETNCGKCKSERIHKIVAVNTDGTIEIVLCATCDSRHKYRAPKRTTRPVTSRAPKAKAVQELTFSEMMLANALPYRMSSVFREGDVIEHAAFGHGQVMTIQGDKIEVRFSQGTKLLVHGRS